MPAEPAHRRLAAILAADVAGYSRLMSVDEEGTLARLSGHLGELVEPCIAQHRGRVVKTTGDGLLAEFASVVDAVKCAASVQDGMRARNAEVAEDRRIVFRIGINLGDVIIEGEDIYGDGVNIAARLESIAEPGGICVSGEVYRQVKSRLDIAFHDLGEQTVKNIADPVHVYATIPGAAAPVPAAAARPSIAVLPFENMSGDADQEFFADGLTEDLITELSRFPGLFVIARHSSFTFKGRNVKVQDAGRELGVAYVLEGSVRKAGNRVRITAQLIETATDKHVWAERYDRELDDIFAVQDDVTRAIAATLPGRLEAAAAEHARRKPTASLAAYDHLLRAKVLHHRGTREDNALGLDAVDKAIGLDPEYAEAFAWRSCLTGQALFRGYLDSEGLFQRILDDVHRAVSLDKDNTECHRILCEIAMENGDFDQAALHNSKALALNPNDPRIVAQKGELMVWMGDPEAAIACLEQALRLDPYGQDERVHLLGYALYTAGRYADAAAALKRVASPKLTQRCFLAACHAELGDDAAAAEQVAQILRLDPAFSTARYLAKVPYKNAADRDRYRASLGKAGLPA